MEDADVGQDLGFGIQDVDAGFRMQMGDRISDVDAGCGMERLGCRCRGQERGCRSRI